MCTCQYRHGLTGTDKIDKRARIIFIVTFSSIEFELKLTAIYEHVLHNYEHCNILIDHSSPKETQVFEKLHFFWVIIILAKLGMA